MDFNKESLEKALSDAGKKESPKQPTMSKDQEIAFHQGCLNTLVNERNELIKIIGNVEAVMQMHLKRLEELGVKIQNQEKK